MSTNHRYQILPPLSPEGRAALKADLAVHGVRIAIDVDEERTVIDGHERKQLADELGIECPERVLTGLTDAQKREHAWRMNLMRRQLTQKQRREIARTLREEGWTQERIAQILGVSQSTIGNWLQQFTNSGKLRQPTNVQGKDGKEYRPEKTRPRTTHPTEEANRPETPQIPSVAGDGPAQAPEQQEPPQPRNTPTEAQEPSSEPPVAADVPDAPETPPLISDELQIEARQRASSPLGSSPVLPAEADAEGWVGALQDLSAKLETLQEQGRRHPPSTCWDPSTRAQGMATLRRMKEIVIELEAVVGAVLGEAADRNGHDDVTLPPVQPLIADAAQEHGNRELVTVSSAEYPVRDAADSHQPSSTRGEPTGPVAGASATLTEISGRANGADPVEPCPLEVRLTAPVATPATQDDRCGWCASTQVWHADNGSGRVHCHACHASYHPADGFWAPGERDKQQCPPASIPATNCTMQDEMKERTCEATANVTVGGDTGMSGQ